MANALKTMRSAAMPEIEPDIIDAPIDQQPMQVPVMVPAGQPQQTPAATLQPTAVYTPNPQRQAREQALQANIQNLQNRAMMPARGFWNKAGRVLSGIGNAAGDVILGPQQMSMIPGTNANRLGQYEGAQGELAQLEGQDQTDRQQAGQDAYRKAQIEHLQHEGQSVEKPYTLATDKGILQWDDAANRWTPIDVNGETVSAPQKASSAIHFQHVAGTSDGKEMYANFDPSTGTYRDLKGNVLTDFKPKDKALQGAYGGFGPAFLAYRMLNSAYNENPALLPYISPLISKMLATSGGAVPGLENVLSQVPTGQPQDESGTPIGLRMPGAPTGTTRSRGQFAGEVLPTMKEASEEIDHLGDKLGPFAGRYSDLVTGKIGAYGPEFSALQTDLHNIATGWGRLHGNSVETMKQFYDDLNASKDPANLKAKLQRYERQAELYRNAGEGKPEGSQNQTPAQPARPANVPEGYVFKANGPKGRGWYKP